MRRIQVEAKSHAAALSFKRDPRDHTRATAGCACMCCRTGTTRSAARLQDTAHTMPRSQQTLLSTGGDRKENAGTSSGRFKSDKIV